MTLDDTVTGDIAEAVEADNGVSELRDRMYASLDGKTPKEIASYYLHYERNRSEHAIMMVDSYLKTKPGLFRMKVYRNIVLGRRLAAQKTARINENPRQQDYDSV